MTALVKFAHVIALSSMALFGVAACGSDGACTPEQVRADEIFRDSGRYGPTICV